MKQFLFVALLATILMAVPKMEASASVPLKNEVSVIVKGPDPTLTFWICYRGAWYAACMYGRFALRCSEIKGAMEVVAPVHGDNPYVLDGVLYIPKGAIISMFPPDSIIQD